MSKNIWFRIGGVVVAIAVAIGVRFLFDKGEEKVEQAKAPKIGECVYFEKDGVSDEAKDATCGSAESSHKVVADDGNCGEGETTYQISRSRSSSDAFVNLCLVPDAAVGDCFDQDESKVECAGAVGTSIKVTSVGKPGDKCANPAQPIAFPKRDLLLCVAPNA